MYLKCLSSRSYQSVKLRLVFVSQKLIEFTVACFFFRATQKVVAIGIFADYGLTGHCIGDKQRISCVSTY